MSARAGGQGGGGARAGGLRGGTGTDALRDDAGELLYDETPDTLDAEGVAFGQGLTPGGVAGVTIRAGGQHG